MLRQLDRDLWVAEQPLRFVGLEIGARMTVVRLPDGRLVVHSPIGYTDELGREVVLRRRAFLFPSQRGRRISWRRRRHPDQLAPLGRRGSPKGGAQAAADGRAVTRARRPGLARVLAPVRPISADASAAAAAPAGAALALGPAAGAPAPGGPAAAVLPLPLPNLPLLLQSSGVVRWAAPRAVQRPR